MTPQTLCGIGRYSGCAPPPGHPLFRLCPQPRSQDCKNRGHSMFLGGTSRNIFKSKLILCESYYSSHTGENLQLGGSVDGVENLSFGCRLSLAERWDHDNLRNGGGHKSEIGGGGGTPSPPPWLRACVPPRPPLIPAVPPRPPLIPDVPP